MRGSPIRTPSDQRSVGSSPRLIAASHVLHRLLVPRHPPCALNNLATQKPTHTPPPALQTRMTERGRAHTYNTRLPQQNRCNRVRRCSRPLCSSQRPTSPPITLRRQTQPATAELVVRQTTGAGMKQRLPAPSGPNSVPTAGPAHHRAPHPPRETGSSSTSGGTTGTGRTGQRSTLEHHPTHTPAPRNGHRVQVRAWLPSGPTPPGNRPAAP